MSKFSIGLKLLVITTHAFMKLADKQHHNVSQQSKNICEAYGLIIQHGQQQFSLLLAESLLEDVFCRSLASTSACDCCSICWCNIISQHGLVLGALNNPYA